MKAGKDILSTRAAFLSNMKPPEYLGCRAWPGRGVYVSKALAPEPADRDRPDDTAEPKETTQQQMRNRAEAEATPPCRLTSCLPPCVSLVTMMLQWLHAIITCVMLQAGRLTIEVDPRLVGLFRLTGGGAGVLRQVQGLGPETFLQGGLD